MKQWYTAVINSQKQNEEGSLIWKNTELLIEGVSYSDVETTINQLAEDGEFEHHGEFSVRKISKSSVTDVPFHFQGEVGVAAQQEAGLQECAEDPCFDEDTNWRVKTETDTILVNAATAVQAGSKVEKMFVGTAIDADITNVQKTKIENVFRLDSE